MAGRACCGPFAYPHEALPQSFEALDPPQFRRPSASGPNLTEGKSLEKGGDLAQVTEASMAEHGLDPVIPWARQSYLILVSGPCQVPALLLVSSWHPLQFGALPFPLSWALSLLPQVCNTTFSSKPSLRPGQGQRFLGFFIATACPSVLHRHPVLGGPLSLREHPQSPATCQLILEFSGIL